jgi:hypothetical protein
MIFAEINVCQDEEGIFTRWGNSNRFDYDNYDGVFEWSTYGWAKYDGTL